jgi:PAS domain S-box-containing protein
MKQGPGKDSSSSSVQKEKTILKTGSAKSGCVAVFSDTPEQCPELVAILETAGYEVRLLGSLDSVRSVCDGGIEPAAVILDMVYKKGENKLAQTIAEIQAHCKYPVPFIFHSVTHDIASRLAAYRAGAARYLEKPADQARVLQMIFELVQQAPEIPYRVLLVGDESEQHNHRAQILREVGMDVRIVSQPLSVFGALDDFVADVILIAMDMKQCSGPELAAILRDEPKYGSVPIVYLSREADLQLQLGAIKHTNEQDSGKQAQPNHLVVELNTRARSYRKSLGEAKTLRAARYELDRQQQALDSHAIVSVADVPGNIVYANEKFCQVSGYTKDELIGQNHRIIKSGRHNDNFFADMWDTVSGGKIGHGEVCNRRKDGSLYWVDTSIVPFVDTNGLPYQYISIRTDISHVKESEERLSRSQSFANIGIWDLNIQNGELIWSEQLAHLFGYPDGDLAQTYDNMLNIVHPDDLQSVWEAINDCVERGISYNIEHRCVWPDGSIHWLLQRGDAIREANGLPLHMLGLVQDVTVRKQAELGLLESNASLEEAQNLAKLGNWEANMQSGELFWSDEIYRIFGQDKTHFTPSVATFHAAVHPDDKLQELESEGQAATGGTHDNIHRIIRPDGEIRHVHELARGVFDDDGRLLSIRGTVQDITELKKTEQALLLAKEAAEAGSRAKSEFLASMSHELRTPLNAILGFSQLFGMDDQLPQATRNNAMQIEHAGRHLLSLVNDLIDLARIEANKMELAIEAVNLKNVISDSLNMVQSMAQHKGIRIILVRCEATDITLQADYKRLRQSLINLLTNAIKYNKPDGTIHMRCAVDAERVRMEVSDTGPGIPLEKQDRIFTAFDRLGEERGEVEGTGIGLVITKRIVEAMDGRIGFESVPGQGSTFWLAFPVTKNAAQPVSQEAEISIADTIPRPVPVHTRRPVVLYIEDNPMNMRLMQQIFAGKKSWELTGAIDAEIGLEMAFGHPPEIILMDINLPGMSGYEALYLLKADARTARIPVIALTANAMKGDRELGMEAGFFDYLVKPLDIPQLMALLGKLLD